MTNCKFCGKDEVQDYTFDNIYSCNDCMKNPENFMNLDDDANDRSETQPSGSCHFKKNEILYFSPFAQWF